MSHRPPSSAGAVAGTTSTRNGDDWRDRAACLDEDPELFWPIGNTGREALLQIAFAKSVCRRCEVMDTCLAEALENGEEYGVWGGQSEDERRSLKRRNARAARAAQPKPAEAKAPPPPTKTEAKRDPITRPGCGRQRGYEAHTRAGERHCDTCKAWRKRGKRVAEAA